MYLSPCRHKETSLISLMSRQLCVFVSSTANKMRQIHASFLLTYVLHYEKVIIGKALCYKELQSVNNTNGEMASHQINIQMHA